MAIPEFVSFQNRSAGVTSFKTPAGEEVALKFDNPANYAGPYSNFLGANIGRYANRIYGGKLEAAGKTWDIETNPGKGDKVTLHGGPQGWDKFDWAGPVEKKRDDGKTSYVFSHTSEHLDNGFPGKVNARVIYTPYSEGGKNILEIEYEAELAEDSPVDETVVSLTNHNYHNAALSNDSVEGTQIQIFANRIIEHQNGNGIEPPTGNFVKHPAVPEDMSAFTLHKDGPFIDHCFVLQDPAEFKGLDTRKTQEPRKAVHLYHPDSKVHVEVLTTEPVFQIYTADHFDIPVLEGEKREFRKRCGVACEPARPTAAAVRPEWRPWVTLKKGDLYGSKTIWTNWKD